MECHSGSSFKSPSHRNQHVQHRDLYKARSPHWKSTYRKRCMDRLKCSRDSVVARLRDLGPASFSDSSVNSLMTSEWEQMCREDASLPQLFGPNRTGKPVELLEDADEVVSVVAQIKAELLQEEQQILQEYEAAQQFDAAAIEAVVADLDSPPVICPVCQRNPLILNKGVVFCQCGIRIDTEQDCVSLEYIRRNLEEGIQQHSNNCLNTPGFGVVNQLGIDNLLMNCQVCDFMYVVI